jgi:hypothetical protein
LRIPADCRFIESAWVLDTNESAERAYQKLGFSLVLDKDTTKPRADGTFVEERLMTKPIPLATAGSPVMHQRRSPRARFAAPASAAALRDAGTMTASIRPDRAPSGVPTRMSVRISDACDPP